MRVDVNVLQYQPKPSEDSVILRQTQDDINIVDLFDRFIMLLNRGIPAIVQLYNVKVNHSNLRAVAIDHSISP